MPVVFLLLCYFHSKQGHTHVTHRVNCGTVEYQETYKFSSMIK